MATYEAHTTHIRQGAEWAERCSLVYPPLSEPGREIRLMHIEPAKNYSADVCIRLSIANLNDKPEFYAMSLAWGDPLKTRKIYLEGLEYLVTINQEDALRNMRRRPAYQQAALWMDVVCINQTDFDERRLMVGMMDQIYKTSMRTVAWLGEPSQLWFGDVVESRMTKINRRLNDDGTFEDCARRANPDYEPFRQACEKDWIDGALWILQRLSENVHLWELPFFIKDETEKFGKYVCTRQWFAATKTLEQLFSFPYWSRLWIIQELTLSPQVPEIHLGTRTIPFSLFSAAASYTSTHMYTCCRSMHPHWMVSDLVSVISANSRLRSYQEEYAKAPLALGVAVLYAQGSRATDPRDFVYGILGLVRQDHRISVDYGMTKNQVFAEYQWKRIGYTGSSDSIWDGGRSSRFIHDKPTWVADWSARLQEDEINLPKNWSSVSATTRNRDPINYSYDRASGVLCVPARKRDRVYQVRYGGNFPMMWDQAGQFACPQLLQIEKSYRRLAQRCKQKIGMGKYWEVLMGGYTHEIFYKASTKPRASVGKQFTPMQCATMESIMQHLEKSISLAEFKNMGTDAYDSFLRLSHWLENSSFFITEEGRIGISELNVRSGDEVFELYGCGAPTLLRKWKLEEEDYGIDLLGQEQPDEPVKNQAPAQDTDEDSYSVVAPCYLSEFMGRDKEDLQLCDRRVELH